MIKYSNKEKILNEGLKVVLSKGFANSSVRDIVSAAEVPLGSFSNHFATKEEFGLEIIDIYFTNTKKVLAETLLNDSLPPIERLMLYVDSNIQRQQIKGVKMGCLYGNFCVELSERSEILRAKILEILNQVQEALVYCLKAAVATGELDKNFDCNEIGRFILYAQQGATLLSKAEKSAEPLLRYKHILQTVILK